MKSTLFIIFIYFVAQVNGQQNTSIFIKNNDHKKLFFYDLITQDSLYFTNKSVDTILLTNHLKGKTLLVINKADMHYNYIILNEKNINTNFNNNNLIEFTDETNNDYQLFIKQLKEIKKQNSSSITNTFIFDYMYKNTDLLVSLEYVKNSLVYKLHSKDSITLLFNKLNPNLKHFSYWDECYNLINTNIVRLRINDTLKNYKVTDIHFEEKLLNINNEKILLFWASWCKPCIEEINILKRLTKIAPKIVLINLDTKKEKWLKSINNNNFNNFKNYYLENQFENIMAIELSIVKTPTNISISNDNLIKGFDIKLYSKYTIIDSFLFKRNISTINNDHKNKIEKLFLKNSQYITRINMYGYTDTIGNTFNNITLAKNRVNNLAKYLPDTSFYNINKYYIGEVDSFNNNRRVLMTIEYVKPLIDNTTNNTKYILIFNHKDYTIIENGRVQLLKLLTDLKKTSKYKINIFAYSCEHEGHVTNLKNKKKYSDIRAEIINKYLIKKGINKNDIHLYPMGIDTTKESLNYSHDYKRRVEIELIVE